MRLLALLIASALGCAATPRATGEAKGRSLPEAEALFRKDPRWLGADAALSIPLAPDRTLWLFGDTFVATSGARVRSQSRMVRNTVAIQTGTDPRSASMTFHWRKGTDGGPASFFPEQGERWYWPGHGVRLERGPLILFLYAIVATPGKGLGFDSAGHAIAIIDDPGVSPDRWRPRILEAPASTFDAVPASAVVQQDAHIVAVAIRQQGTHAGALVRHPAAKLANGNLSGAEWWAGKERGWLPESALGAAGPEFVIDDAGSECSLHWDERTRCFLHVASYGFGASTIGLRRSPAITGPWSAPVTVYRPPESDGRRPFVYAAKAHPELTGADPSDLLVTYATNSFDFGDLFTQDLYWPRVVAIHLEESR